MLSNIHIERNDLLRRMFDLQKDNATLEKLLQMQLLRLLSVQEFSNALSESDFDKMTLDHTRGHTVSSNNNQSNDAYK